MEVAVAGASGSEEARIRAALKAASRGLGWQLDRPVEVTDPADEGSDSDAGIESHRLWIRPATLSLLKHPNELAGLLAEEVAHAYLESLGVPHESPAAVLYQEAFAKWFFVRRLRDLLPSLVAGGLVRAVPGVTDARRAAYRFGCLVGYAGAHVPTAREVLAAELEALEADNIIRLITESLVQTQLPTAPRKRAEAIACAYTEAVAKWAPTD